MGDTTQAHAGFDHQTTIDGETVPTRFDRNLARTLKSCPNVDTVGWSGWYPGLVVYTTHVPDVVRLTAEAVTGQHTGFEVEINQMDDGTMQVILEIDR